MKIAHLKSLARIVVAGSLTVLAPTVFACGNYSGGGTIDPTCSDPVSESWNLAANTRSNGALAIEAITGWATTGSYNKLQQETVVNNNGLGVYTAPQEDPNHGTPTIGSTVVDNYGDDEVLVINFADKVSLNSLTIGWNGTDDGAKSVYDDSDVTVYAWTKSTGAPALAGKSVGSLLNDGWEKITLALNVGSTASNSVTFNTSNKTYSSYWLIGALTSDGCDPVDAFKLLTVAGVQCDPTNAPDGNKTPEPTSLALMGAAMMGLVASRRRKQKSA